MIWPGFPAPDQNAFPQKKTGIVDERSEIAGRLRGIPQHSFGRRIDVLDACPKAEGLMMMIRSMSPDVIIVDEIGRMEDSQAAAGGAPCGRIRHRICARVEYERLGKEAVAENALGGKRV